MVDDNGEIVPEKDDQAMPDFDPDNSEDGPLPIPPLSHENYHFENKIQHISLENWDEGCNAKFKAYQKLKEEKDKMFEENKVFKKYRGIWRGLKRCHKRAT